MPIKTYSFTTKYKNIRSNVLQNKVSVSEAYDFSNPPKNISYKEYLATWDTGATNTVVTQKVVQECGLKPIGIVRVHTVAGDRMSNVYFVSIRLPNIQIPEIRVTEGIVFGKSEILIGMDIINKGDFAVTNKNGFTVFSFRYPSLECIDFVKTPYKEKPIKVTKKIGRNDPCPCGSGKKYKNCCLKKKNEDLENKNIL